MKLHLPKTTTGVHIVVTDAEAEGSHVSVCVQKRDEPYKRLTAMSEEEMTVFILKVAEEFTKVCMKRVGNQRVWNMER